jgi:transcriptional regulator with XRE-family HTH domain
MSPMPYPELTPLPVGSDPFRVLPMAECTCTGWPSDRLPTSPSGRRGFVGSAWAILAALTPTSSSALGFKSISREATDRLSSTSASTEAIAPLLGFLSSITSSTGIKDRSPGPRQSTSLRALGAVQDLTGWLGLTEEQVADAAGYSRRSISNWRKGETEPYPKTVRGLFEMHSLVAGLVRAIGIRGARGWLAIASESGGRRMQMLGSQDGRSQLLAEAQPLLFARAEREQPVPDFDEPPLTASPENVAAAEILARTPPKRRRRPQ